MFPNRVMLFIISFRAYFNTQILTKARGNRGVNLKSRSETLLQSQEGKVLEVRPKSGKKPKI